MSLQHAWEQSGRSGDGPPMPLILNGWVFSNDHDKNRRWLDTIEWAKEHGLSELIPELKDGEKHLVIEFSSYAGPVPGEQFEKSKTKPTTEELKQILKKLQDDWAAIVGSELAAMTYPLRFTGHKKRQLIVRADADKRSPWGGWNWFGRDGNRHAFTDFRKRINHAISPHGVDHIVFNEVAARK